MESLAIPPFLSLTAPVGSLMRPTLAVAPEDSVQRAITELRKNDADILPIVRDLRLLGVVTQSSLARSLAEGVDLIDPVTNVLTVAETIAPYATGAEALRKLATLGASTLIVVDDGNRVIGIIGTSDLVPSSRQAPRPPLVGGMATPFGVYLTNGAVSGGANGFALVSTGALMFTMLVSAQLAVEWSMPYLLRAGFPESASEGLQAVLSPALFLIGMRLVPLSGTHAAEHQVVHALERGEALLPEIVRRMPRVHPRCGTNLAVAVTLFLGLFGMEWNPSTEVRLLTAMLVTALLWKRLGALLQQFITTRPANEKQLKSGIRAANQLLEAYAKSRNSVPSIPLRIWNSGLIHVMAGSGLAAAVTYFISERFNLGIRL